MNFLLPTFDLLFALYCQLKLQVAFPLLKIIITSFTFTLLGQITDQSITFMTDYFHPGICILKLLALTPKRQNTNM